MPITPSISTYGPQYGKDDPFKAAARLHQSRFRAEQLGIADYRDYGSRLPTEAARAGRNFYPWPGLLDVVSARFPFDDQKLYWDMLASDNVPFNFFVPLRTLPFTPALLAAWTGDVVERVSAIEIEWKPAKREHLDDRTSFDVFVTYVRPGRRPTLGGLGVEVKYTEREYSWSKREKERMADPMSAYHQVHRASEVYRDGALSGLVTRRLKQLWRNQLLGEAMLQRGTVARFTSMLLYPAANQHFAEVVHDYAELLDPTRRDRFTAVPYETFITSARRLCSDADAAAWLDYLEKRYIVTVAGARPANLRAC